MKLTKTISLLSICILFFSCKVVAQSTQDEFIAIVTYKDSTRYLVWITRAITKIVVTDPVTKADAIKSDTVFAQKYFIPLLDPKTKKPILKNGQQQADPTPRYLLFNKDSVRIKGIEGVPLSVLLDKKGPTH